jgi:hypothetical protein
MTTVYGFEKKCDRFINDCKIVDLYMSKHFFERAVERNLDAANRFPQIARMIKEVYISFKSHSYNEYSYKVIFKDLAMIAMVRCGTVSNRRMLILKTIWDSDPFKDDFSEVIKIS